MEIVEEYSDHGRSGLNIAGREGLNKLMSDVESKRPDFLLNERSWPRFYDLMQIAAPDDIEIETLNIPLGDDWRR
jgi:hypothetical protein